MFYKGKRKIKNIIGCSFAMLFSFSFLFANFLIDANAAEEMVATASFTDTKTYSGVYRCPGYYAIDTTKTKEAVNGGDECRQNHMNGCDNACYDATCGDYWVEDSDAYGVVCYRVEHHCNGIRMNHHTYGGRYRTTYTKCAVCGSTGLNDVEGGKVDAYGYCSGSRWNTKMHWMQAGPNGNATCAFCGKESGTSYTGRCNRSYGMTKTAKWNTTVKYTDPQDIAKTDTLTGKDDEIIIVKYGSNAKVSVNNKNIPQKSDDSSSVNLLKSAGNIVGYDVYVNGSLKASVGTKDTTNTMYNYSECQYNVTSVKNVQKVQYVLYTSAGSYILPVITIVPRFYWIDYDLSDGGKVINGETSSNMSSGGGQASITNAPKLGCFNSPVTIPNPVRPGFKFVGWMIEGMDDGTVPYEEISSHYHYWSKTTASYDTTDFRTQATQIKGDIGNGPSEFYGKENVTYVPANYTSFLNLRVDIGQHVKFTAIWQDTSNDLDTDPTFGNLYSEFGHTYQNIEDGTNSDSTLKLSVQSDPYTVQRSDGTYTTQYFVTMAEQYSNVYQNVYAGIDGTNLRYDTINEYHEHTGDPVNGGGCYSKPIYHAHTSDCYTDIVHIHTGNAVDGGGCYTIPIIHEHTGSVMSGGGCYTIPVYHTHVKGFETYDADTDTYVNTIEPSSVSPMYTTTNPGGCYKASGHTHNKTGTCPTHQITVKDRHSVVTGCPRPNDPTAVVDYCTGCGKEWGAHTGPSYHECSTHKETVYDCGSYTNTWVLGCGKKEGVSIDYYKPSCNHTKGEIIGYNLGCGLEEGDIEGEETICGHSDTDIEGYALNCGMTEDTIVSSIKILIGGSYSDYVDVSLYPNYYGKTENKSRYYTEDESVTKYYAKYPDMYPWLDNWRSVIQDTSPVFKDSTQKKGETRGWTNKSVTLTATAFDGSDGKNPTQIGGSGILRMKFDDEEWINSEKRATDNSSMSIAKTFTKSGIYEGTVTVEDRAGTTVKYSQDGKNNAWIDSGSGNNVTTIGYGLIKIDKDDPYILDPSAMDDSTLEFRNAMYLMYEGYNDIRDVSNGDTYGWSRDNVRIVLYADDSNKNYGMGSGIVQQGYCWNKDPNIASNWQSADDTRSYKCADGVTRMLPVSTRVVTENEAGYAYVRDAVGNWTRIEYKVDHIDKQNPDVYPEKDPDSTNDDPLPPDPLDPDDSDAKDYNPIPDGKYNFESSLSKNEIKYDWVNHDATLSFKSVDYQISIDGSKINPGSGTGNKYGSSGTYKMTLWRSNSEFPTVTETLRNGKTRQRADSTLYGSETKAAETLFRNQLQYVEEREGISYYILEVLDKAENLTTVKLTVKIDKTYPGIPYQRAEGSTEEFGVQNGTSTNGNDLLSNFPSGKYWRIEQADLNKADYDKVEAYIQNEENMKCTFEFKIYDQNWSGSYAYGSNKAIDSSGFDKITLKLIDADDSSNHESYILYDYDNLSNIGKNTLGSTFSTTISEKIKTSECNVSYLNGALSGEPYAYIHTISKINTFRDFPYAAALNYEIEIVDRAGNVKTYSNEPGNEIRNFSIKAVMHSAEDSAYNDETTYTQSNVAENDTNITRTTYVYENRRGVEFGSSYKLSKEECEERGLTYVGESVWNGKSTSSVSTSIEALTNVPYYQLGDMGYVEVWTVGYVPKIQFNFGVLGDPIGEEMTKEIAAGRIPAKYNLGVVGNSLDTKWNRDILSTSGIKIPVSYANDYGSIPFAVHYGVQEAADFVDPTIDTQSGWLDAGTSIRIPLYYKLQPDGTKKSDGQDNFEAELHSAAFYAWKGNWKDTSTASYIIYDTRADDVHYRITHES